MELNNDYGNFIDIENNTILKIINDTPMKNTQSLVTQHNDIIYHSGSIIRNKHKHNTNIFLVFGYHMIKWLFSDSPV
jgi:hypothetical protein